MTSKFESWEECLEVAVSEDNYNYLNILGCMIQSLSDVYLLHLFSVIVSVI